MNILKKLLPDSEKDKAGVLVILIATLVIFTENQPNLAQIYVLFIISIISFIFILSHVLVRFLEKLINKLEPPNNN